MSWLEPVSFAEAPFEIIDGDRGKNYPKQDEFHGVGHCLFLSVTNVTKSGFDFSTCQFIDEKKDAALNKGKLQREDLVLTTRGTIGNTAYFNNAVPFEHLRINSGMVILRCDRDKLLPAFLYHFLRSPSFYSQVNGLRSGVAQPQLPIRDMRQIRLPLPSLPEQRRIAGILSNYDELIENNQRRIRILEEMARSLYREWFVHFRYPGHESSHFVDSPLGQIPQGWEVKKLDEACRSIQDGDWIETKDQGGNDYRLLQISNIGIGEFVETGNYRFVTQETFDRLRCNEIVPGDLLVARMPTPIGRGWLATSMPWKMITAVDVAIIRAQPELINPLFLVQAWNEQPNLQRIAAQASGTTRLRITRRELAALDFIIPPIEMQQRFADITSPQAELIQALRLKTQNLRLTRDLLLPRLLSGLVAITVSEPEFDEVMP